MSVLVPGGPITRKGLLRVPKYDCSQPVKLLEKLEKLVQ
jgi:hypothetical protein